jgi:CheY-specific phosphatase CheX
MSNKMQQALFRAAALTFEELGFMFPENTIDEQRQNVEEQTAVSVEFKGPLNGRLVLRLYGNLLPTLAANMLGNDEPPTPKLQNDALGEIANVICGNMLPEIAGFKAVFQLGAPKIVSRADAGSVTANHPPAAAVCLGIEEGRADVFLFIDEEKENPLAGGS